jgi:hypothetical protein
LDADKTRATTLICATTAPSTTAVTPDNISKSQHQPKEECDFVSKASTYQEKESCDLPPFTNIMAANRAEIAVRIMRAATELNSGTVAICTDEDRYSQHRWGADKSYVLNKKDKDSTPISAYLDIDEIIRIAKRANVDAIHPRYGFLSESPKFA